MSWRTVIELNHDRINELTWDDFRLIIQGLGACSFEIGRDKPIEPVRCIRILAQRHHSEKLEITVG